MGQYINDLPNGKGLPMAGKAKFLLENVPGTTVIAGKEYVPDMVCVADNGGFDAAAYMYSQREYEYFRDNSGGRGYTWLQVPGASSIAK